MKMLVSGDDDKVSCGMCHVKMLMTRYLVAAPMLIFFLLSLLYTDEDGNDEVPCGCSNV